jgi:hypothetical protein
MLTFSISLGAFGVICIVRPTYSLSCLPLHCPHLYTFFRVVVLVPSCGSSLYADNTTVCFQITIFDLSLFKLVFSQLLLVYVARPANFRIIVQGCAK